MKNQHDNDDKKKIELDNTDYSKLTLDELFEGIHFATPETDPDLFRGFRIFSRPAGLGAREPLREVTKLFGVAEYVVKEPENTGSPGPDAIEPSEPKSPESPQLPDDNGGNK